MDPERDARMPRPETRIDSKENQTKCFMNDVSTKKVLRNFVIMIPTFYMMFYSISSITYAAFGKTFHIRAPFDFKMCCLTDTEYQANGLSIILSYLFSTFPFILVTLVRLWDHILTITVFHILITCIVMLQFPLNWQWWVALVIGVFSSLLFGETIAYCLQQRFSKKYQNQNLSGTLAE